MLFNEYLLGRLTHAKYVGEIKKLNEKYIQNKNSKTSYGSRTSKQQETPSLEEDTWFI